MGNAHSQWSVTEQEALPTSRSSIAQSSVTSNFRVAVFYLQPVKSCPPPQPTRRRPESSDHICGRAGSPEAAAHFSQLLVQLLALLLAQLPSQHLDQLQAQMLAVLLPSSLPCCWHSSLASCFSKQPGGGAVTHRQPPIIDCVSNFGLFDVDSTHAARQPRPGAVPASQGAV